MKFIDSASITIEAGKGGNGIVAFRREKYESRGGPAGGDGGKGGNIYFKGNSGLTTLLDFKFKNKLSAQNGFNGQNKNMHGADGEDIIIQVPLGTVLINMLTNRIIADICDEEKYLIAKGGKGGLGNSHFKNSTNRAPRISNNGKLGERFEVQLELKVLADVGFVGMPNAGKSTLLAAVTNAKPQIANYAFTTINPQLGLVRTKNNSSFVIADLPGLIEGASLGKGLGDLFLKHIERCRVIVNVIDFSVDNPEDTITNYDVINKELSAYKKVDLSTKPKIIVANKSDSEFFEENIKYFKNHFKNIEIFEISGLLREGLDKVLSKISEKLKKTPLTINLHDQESFIHLTLEKIKDQFTVQRISGKFIVSGTGVDRIMQKIPTTTYENLARMNLALNKIGV